MTADAVAQIREALEWWSVTRSGTPPFPAALTALDSLEAELERLTKLAAARQTVSEAQGKALAKRNAENERLRAVVGPDFHVYEQREDGWSLKHPLPCRDEMLDCEVHRIASMLAEPPVEPGRYRAELVNGALSLASLESGEKA